MRKALYVFTILLASHFGFSTTFQPYEHINLFQGTFSTGMGKAITAIKDLGTESFFANPANGGGKLSIDIISINPFQFNNVTIEILGKLNEIQQDVSQLFDYIGRPMNVRAGVNLIGINIPIHNFSLNLGTFSTIYTYLEVHNPLSSAGLLDILGFLSIGAYIGTSYSLKNLTIGVPELEKHLKHASIGINMKLATSSSINRKILLSDLLRSSEYLQNVINEQVNTLLTDIRKILFIPDIGISYELPIDELQKINFGLSILNIGGLPIGDSYIPTTVNLGIAYHYDLSTLIGNSQLLQNSYISLDIHDIFFQRKDKDFFKRLHIGIKSDLANLNDIVLITLGLGINQGYPTFGLGIKLAILKFSYSISAEELGVYAGQDPDLRQNLSISIGW